MDYLEKMTTDMQLRGLRESTQQRYLCAIREAQEFFDDWPLHRLAYEQLRGYVNLTETKTPGARLMRVAALRFLYGQTLGMPLTVERIPYPRQPKSPPPFVLNPE